MTNIKPLTKMKAAEVGKTYHVTGEEHDFYGIVIDINENGDHLDVFLVSAVMKYRFRFFVL